MRAEQELDEDRANRREVGTNQYSERQNEAGKTIANPAASLSKIARTPLIPRSSRVPPARAKTEDTFTPGHFSMKIPGHFSVEINNHRSV